MPLFRKSEPARSLDTADPISRQCSELKAAKTRGELGMGIARIVLAHSPKEIQQMKRNFDTKVLDLPAEYRDRLSARITEHLLGTFQRIRLDDQQGILKTLHQPLSEDQKNYWDMVGRQCSGEGEADAPALRFLKYLLAGYCMLVLDEPGHPPGTPFPGGDEVEFTNGIYYCPVRDREGDVDAALCPWCPARQTPQIGYLRPATRPTERNKQELIDNCYRYHNFNG
ncbi:MULTISPECIES: DUF2115 domain-containing protein [unclassified Methanoregula]|uniref:DUF2115 domain-containing protein n=1 Tax=unclassified Methanoregula TaxID=2649730 RepID=UPI0009D59599|nr:MULTISPECIES: DUF2115 domain-containing protein [unclassified Methanoregula]OPX65033.1 MAG: hypothetical protein A4E33_00474 [Methanoregula sp. PtaB.Bin085]OPY32363.1 MAG: hypothetical protein A4E34_02738 [Methanoregula sp. PtaU1.Bin006]